MNKSDQSIWRQPELFSALHRTREDGERLLSAPGRTVRLVITRNRAVMISIRQAADGSAEVRMVKEFLNAPDTVWQALRLFLSTRRRAAWRTVLAYTRTIKVAPLPPAQRPRPARPPRAGVFYNLEEIAQDVNRRFFSGRIKCEVIWSRPPPLRRKNGRRRSIRYGAYNHASKSIRINPLLDNPLVPREFVEYIVFHEMLHDTVPPETVNGRQYVHTRNFKQLERQFPGYPRMLELCRTMLDTLIQESRRSPAR